MQKLQFIVRYCQVRQQFLRIEFFLFISLCQEMSLGNVTSGRSHSVLPVPRGHFTIVYFFTWTNQHLVIVRAAPITASLTVLMFSFPGKR